ncbi:MAG TPA: DNA-binding response regulator, partial [Myxococcales bacterium]|nr:DNA-binding response regulator [Myxococcales bacterium]
PGNVRELRNQIERIVLLSEDEAIEGWQFERVSGELVQLSVDDEEGEPELRIRMPASGLPLVEVEKRLIRRALEMNDGNVTRTARYLSITRQTLIYRMRKFGLSRQ